MLLFRRTPSANRPQGGSRRKSSMSLFFGSDSDGRRDVGGAAGEREAVASAAQRLDRLVRVVGVELAAQAADENFDHVAVALEVLVVERLGDLRLRQHLARVQHQVLEQLVLEAREVELAVMDLDLLRARVER